MPATAKLNPWVKIALDIGPLILFFVVNARAGIYAATGAFMVAVLIALAVSWVQTRHLAVMPLVTAVVVSVFGGLTLVLHDETFIKLKPTIIYALFSATLLGGLILRKPLLGMVFDAVFNLTDEGWRKLTWRWALFFFVLAAMNEVVWRTQTDDVWIKFKTFGVMSLTLAFALAQTPLLMRHEAGASKS